MNAPPRRMVVATQVLILASLAGLAILAMTGGLARAASFDQGFKTPSGNIMCMHAGGFIRCDIGTGVRPLPPRPRDCDVDFGQGVGMGKRGRAQIVCAGDTVFGAKVPALRYGRTWRRGGFSCVSRSNGLTCRNLNGRGFFMSRARTRLF